MAPSLSLGTGNDITLDQVWRIQRRVSKWSKLAQCWKLVEQNYISSVVWGDFNKICQIIPFSTFKIMYNIILYLYFIKEFRFSRELSYSNSSNLCFHFESPPQLYIQMYPPWSHGGVSPHKFPLTFQLHNHSNNSPLDVNLIAGNKILSHSE